MQTSSARSHRRSACSGVKALRNTSAARRQAAKLCYRFGPLTPSARSANRIAGDGTKNDFRAPNKEPPDWVVFAGANGYPADEAYFLHDIIHTIGTALAGNPQLDAELLSTWVAQRHAQIEQGTLVYIAHQLDVLGRVPVPMGKRQVGKP